MMSELENIFFSVGINVNLVDRLEITVGEIGCHLADSLLISYCGLWSFLSCTLHHQPDQVVAADLLQLRGLLLLRLGLNGQEGDGEQDGPEPVSSLPKLATGGKLVGGLQPGHKVGKFQTNCWERGFGGGIPPIGEWVVREGWCGGESGQTGGSPGESRYEVVFVWTKLDHTNLHVSKLYFDNSHEFS